MTNLARPASHEQIPELQLYVQGPLAETVSYQPDNNFKVDYGFWDGTRRSVRSRLATQFSTVCAIAYRQFGNNVLTARNIADECA